MTGDYLLEKLLDSFQNSYDVERTCDINGDIYEAYASFNATSAKYVLVKKAELWRAKCFEHVFFSFKKEFRKRRYRKFQKQDRCIYRTAARTRWLAMAPEGSYVYVYDGCLYL